MTVCGALQRVHRAALGPHNPTPAYVPHRSLCPEQCYMHQSEGTNAQMSVNRQHIDEAIGEPLHGHHRDKALTMMWLTACRPGEKGAGVGQLGDTVSSNDTMSYKCEDPGSRCLLWERQLSKAAEIDSTRGRAPTAWMGRDPSLALHGRAPNTKTRERPSVTNTPGHEVSCWQITLSVYREVTAALRELFQRTEDEGAVPSLL